jgi:predicted transcriptional regulator
MAGKSTSIHISEALIKRLDERAGKIRRTRNWLIIEGIELVLESYDKDDLEKADNYKKAGK